MWLLRLRPTYPQFRQQSIPTLWQDCLGFELPVISPWVLKLSGGTAWLSSNLCGLLVLWQESQPNSVHLNIGHEHHVR